MRKLLYISLYCLIVPLSLFAQHDSYALFVENEGQWEEDFAYKLRLSSGSMFFENTGYTMLLIDPETVGHSHDDDSHSHAEENIIKKQAIKLDFLNANPFPAISGNVKTPFYYNYLIGNDRSKWKSDVGVYRKIVYTDIYPGIDIQYYGTHQDLKYDFIVEPGADWRLIQMQYQGADKIRIKNNKLIISTIFGDLIEEIPSVYQIIEGERIEVDAFYDIKDNVVYFDLGDYDPNHELIIDPKLIFSSFTGSSADNWGYTATYDNAGNLYGGGIIFNKGGTYPTSLGAFQTTFSGANRDFDIGISKFNEQGNQLIFSTFLGGNSFDVPQSLVVDSDDNLYILGATSSNNFPIPVSGGYQEGFAGGSRDSTSMVYSLGTDIFVSKLSFDGKNLLASTYLGGTENDGLNFEIFKNYGDDARSEIIVDNSAVYIVSNSQSTSLNLLSSSSPVNHGKQDALVVSFNTDLTAMNWGSFFGGSNDDAGYSLKLDALGSLFISGGTKSGDLPFSNGSIVSSNQGGLDGYIAKINAQDGSFTDGSYIGTPSDDQTFILDIDQDNFVYAFGQSKGAMTITPNMYSQSGSQQYIKKFDNSLENEIWSTQIGSGQNKSDLVPTAFLVDDCYNIYLSGWNGNSNRVSFSQNPLGNTNGLPTTSDAQQSTTDGSDFYFMVLDRDAKNLSYSTFFGGTADEHVDGGTSRFNPNGSIFQAVCAGCSERGFPTTPGAYSTANGSSNCNLGVIKFDFEITVRSKPEIDFGIDTDTICDSLIVRFRNSSINADIFQWDFDNGLFSDQVEPITHFAAFGNYTVRLIAIDTNCNISDTSYLSIDHFSGENPIAQFNSDYLSCDSKFNVSFSNSSKEANLYEWDFGDGGVSYNSDPSHQFPAFGSYIVSLTAYDSICQKFSFYSDTIVFSDTTIAPNPIAKIAECGDGSVDIVLNEDRDRYIYTWDFGDGQKVIGKQPLFLYSEPGNYVVSVTVEDTSCHKSYSYDYPITIENIGREMFIPNAFSPNGDGLNDSFQIFGNHCGTDDELKVFNRWGQLIFHTNRPFEEFWDATLEDEPAPIGIYSYVIRNGKHLKKGSITVFR